jgi:hypothetical protein
MVGGVAPAMYNHFAAALALPGGTGKVEADGTVLPGVGE